MQTTEKEIKKVKQIRNMYTDTYLATVYVHDSERAKALLYLKGLEEDGMDVNKILGISDEYYRDKVKRGLVPMSALIYTRIMLETPAMPLPKTNFCVRCGKSISAFRIYCPECRSDIKKPASNWMPKMIKCPKKSNHIKDF